VLCAMFRSLMSVATENSMKPVINDLLSVSAHALRPVRMVQENPVHYTATTFPNGPRAGCSQMLRMADVTGGLGHAGEELKDFWVDVLDANGDILQEWPINKKCFDYLRRKLRFVRE